MDDKKNKQVEEQVELTAEDMAIVNAIVEEETKAKLDDIQEYIESGDLDKDIAKAHEEQADEEA